jgi:Sec-independent protein translocase protein TatA
MLDVLFILLLALVIFGPKKLPELAMQAGKYLAQFRQVKGQLMEQISSEIRSFEEQAYIRQEPDAGRQIAKPIAGAGPEGFSG